MADIQFNVYDFEIVQFLGVFDKDSNENIKILE